MVLRVKKVGSKKPCIIYVGVIWEWYDYILKNAFDVVLNQPLYTSNETH